MRWIKGDLIVEADVSKRGSNLLRGSGFQPEYEIREQEKKRLKKEKLQDWLRDNVCTGCKKVHKKCICEDKNDTTRDN